ncbi:VWA domain-containing protein [Arthrobacter sp. StoSoilB22]|nr:VWA domain-containing protein [Arthrobacter sp. StoSoilB22]
MEGNRMSNDAAVTGDSGALADSAGPGRDRLSRWRLVLGGHDADGISTEEGVPVQLSDDDVRRDEALEELYGGGSARRGGLGSSSPRVARWLGDIRGYFPSSVVQVMQADAMDRLGLRQLLLEPEMLRTVQPDIGLVSTLVGLGRVIPEESRETARSVIRQVTKELEERLRAKTIQAVSGALNRSARTRRPRHRDIDWNRTIAANLKHYQPEYRTVVPERLHGHARRSTEIQREIILCIDQSGSMAESVVYSSVFGAVLSSLKSVSTRLVVFDTEVVDLTEDLDDPVDVLFGVQLGGGTDINRALAYCQDQITKPAETILVLISDLYEGGIAEEMLRRAASIVGGGTTMIALLALSDSGHPSFDSSHAAALAGIGVPAFACTPDLFPDMMAAAIERRDVSEWAASQDIPTSHEK